MANTILSLAVFGLVLLAQRVGATEYKVGGNSGWSLISDPNTPSYNQWAEKNRFQVGDSLLFVYPPDKDSVLQVNMDDYTNCNTGSPIATFNDGNTVFKFSQSGAHYFISGMKDNCVKNEKMHVVVMADRSNRSSSTNGTAMAPPPSPEGPLATPPSPPPSGVIETVPAPAPEGEESPCPPAALPPNGASAVLFSAIGSVGAFVGYSSLLLLL